MSDSRPKPAAPFSDSAPGPVARSHSQVGSRGMCRPRRGCPTTGSGIADPAGLLPPTSGRPSGWVAVDSRPVVRQWADGDDHLSAGVGVVLQQPRRTRPSSAAAGRLGPCEGGKASVRPSVRPGRRPDLPFGSRPDAQPPGCELGGPLVLPTRPIGCHPGRVGYRRRLGTVPAWIGFPGGSFVVGKA